jgi:hypothetical protein
VLCRKTSGFMNGKEDKLCYVGKHLVLCMVRRIHCVMEENNWFYVW